MTPYYEHAGITIYHGDCRDVLPSLETVDLVLTDPPYGVNWNFDYESTWTRSPRQTGGVTRSHPEYQGNREPFDPAVLIDACGSARLIIWGANNFPEKLSAGSWLIWDKRFPVSQTAVRADAEVAWMNSGYGCYIKSIYEQGFLRPEGAGVHPTQKPIELMKWCIGRAGAVSSVCDPYFGSGTTLIAAKSLGLHAIGIEIEERYCEIAAKRLSQEVFNFAEAIPDSVKTDRGGLPLEEA